MIRSLEHLIEISIFLIFITRYKKYFKEMYMRKSICCFLIIIGAILFLNFQVHADSCFKMIDLESRAGGSFFPYSINANGQVAGACWCAGQTQAALWDPASGMRNLGALPGSIGSNAYGINTIGQIVGGCRTDDGNRAFIWDPVNGMQDLGILDKASR